MIKYAVLVDGSAELFWLYGSDNEWKSYVCPRFDENVVLCGNSDCYEIEEASWWEAAKSIIAELDTDNYAEYDDADGEEESGRAAFIKDFRNSIARDKLEDIWDAYEGLRNSHRYSDDNDFIAEIAMILYPGLSLSTDQISGYREWQNVVYVDDAVDVGVLGDFIFGNLYEVGLFELDLEAMAEDEVTPEDLDANTVEDYGELIEGWCVMSDTEYWKKYRNHPEESFAEFFGYPADEIIVITN